MFLGRSIDGGSYMYKKTHKHFDIGQSENWNLVATSHDVLKVLGAFWWEKFMNDVHEGQVLQQTES